MQRTARLEIDKFRRMKQPSEMVPEIFSCFIDGKEVNLTPSPRQTLAISIGRLVSGDELANLFSTARQASARRAPARLRLASDTPA